MVGLFQSFFHPQESFSLASKGWPTAEIGGTPPRGFQRLGVSLEAGTGTEDRAGRGLAGLITLWPLSWSAGSDRGSLALVAASGSGTPLLPLERLSNRDSMSALCLLAFPFPLFPFSFSWQLQGSGALGAGGRGKFCI